jgi:hypothetical protein
MYERFNPYKFYGPNDLCVWHELKDDARRAVIRTLWLGGLNKADSEEASRLIKILGFDFFVHRKDTRIGDAAGLLPRIYKPEFLVPDTFIMLSPIGEDAYRKVTWYEPPGHVCLTDASVAALKARLFPPGKEPAPVIEFPPFPAKITSTPAPTQP